MLQRSARMVLVSLRGTMNGQPWLFKWRQFEGEIIICAVRCYLCYSLPYRAVQELLAEGDINVDHSNTSLENGMRVRVRRDCVI